MHLYRQCCKCIGNTPKLPSLTKIACAQLGTPLLNVTELHRNNLCKRTCPRNNCIGKLHLSAKRRVDTHNVFYTGKYTKTQTNTCTCTRSTSASPSLSARESNKTVFRDFNRLSSHRKTAQIKKYADPSAVWPHTRWQKRCTLSAVQQSEIIHILHMSPTQTATWATLRHRINMTLIAAAIKSRIRATWRSHSSCSTHNQQSHSYPDTDSPSIILEECFVSLCAHLTLFHSHLGTSVPFFFSLFHLSDSQRWLKRDHAK